MYRKLCLFHWLYFSVLLKRWLLFSRMAKSKAQRMREYRERKKAKLGHLWLKAETDRVKGYYVPTSELNANSQRKRRLKNKENQFKFPNKRRTQNNVEPTQEPVSDNTISSTSDTTLTVRLPFKNSNTKSSSGKKRISRALSRSYKRIETLEDRNEDLQRKLKYAKRRLQRYEAKTQANTPKSKTDIVWIKTDSCARNKKETDFWRMSDRKN